MHKNYFDIVMNYIEENVDKPTEEIKREIPKLIGRNGRAFSESFALLTGHTLDYYIRQRRLLYAVRDLVLKYKEPIPQIALAYQFSDHAAFSRAVKAKYHFTPTEIRNQGILLDEEPYCFADFAAGGGDSRSRQLIRSMDIGNRMTGEDMRLLYEIDEINKEHDLDWDTCCLIMDLAEKLDVPFPYLYEVCTSAMVDAQNELHACEFDSVQRQSWQQELGIESDEEEAAICEFFHTKYLDENMVARYREEQAKRSKEE